MGSSTSSLAVSFPMTRRGTSNLCLVTRKRFAFHPHVVFIKLARQSGNSWFDCVYMVLRDGCKKQFLTIADCSKKRFLKNFGVREDISIWVSESISCYVAGGSRRQDCLPCITWRW